MDFLSKNFKGYLLFREVDLVVSLRLPSRMLRRVILGTNVSTHNERFVVETNVLSTILVNARCLGCQSMTNLVNWNM